MKIFAKITHYLARTLAVLFVLMMAAFIGEGFDPSYGWQSGVMHGVIALFALGLAVLAFKKPLTGGLVFLALASAFLAVSVVAILRDLPSQTAAVQFIPAINPMSGILGFIGLLFVADYYLNSKRKGVSPF
jgi:hypothetical protein